jgi:hypothetical protein
MNVVAKIQKNQKFPSPPLLFVLIYFVFLPYQVSTKIYKTDTMNRQSDDFKYFLDHHDELLKQHRNKFVVISDRHVRFADDTFERALKKALDGGLEMGTFIVQECTEGNAAYTRTFHSRAIFA